MSCFRRDGLLSGRPGLRRAPRVLTPEVADLEPRIMLSTAAAVEPSPYEQYMLELINRARANPAAEGQRLLAIAQSDPVIEQATAGSDLSAFISEISSFGPLPPLAFNTRLNAAAQDHDQAMLAANSQFHSASGSLVNPAPGQTDSDGLPYFQAGNSSWSTAENIFAYSGNVATRTETQVVDYFDEAFFLDWGNPEFGHLKNLLAPGPGEATSTSYPLSEIGIGLLTGVTPTTPPPPTAELSGNQGQNVGPDLVTQEFGWVQGQQFLTGVAYNDQANTNFYAPGEGLAGVQIQAVGAHGEGTYEATTWNSGGYSLELPAGTYNVTASGGALNAPQTTTVTIGSDNVGWDIRTTPGAAASPPVTTSPPTTSTPTPTPTPTPTTPTPTPTTPPAMTVVAQRPSLRAPRKSRSA